MWSPLVFGLSLLLCFNISKAQLILDSNHVYNAETKELMSFMRWDISAPNDSLGIDLSSQVYSICDLTLELVAKDSLKYISEMDTTNMYWSVVGHQYGKFKDRVGVVLTIPVSAPITTDFYTHAVGGFYILRSDCFGLIYASKKLNTSAYRYYFVLDLAKNEIVYFQDPTKHILVRK